jgi:ABC-type nitrate/sulfonate/bicarbonate transport system permease component
MTTDVRTDRAPRVRSARNNGRRSGISPIQGLVPLALALVLWQIFGADDNLWAPRPSAWIAQIVNLAESGVLWEALLSTVQTFAISVLVATIIGSALGALVGRNRVADQMFGPIFEFFRVLPPPAIVPFAVLIAGYTENMKVGVVVISAVWPILLQVRSGARNIDPNIFDVARVLRLSRLSVLRKIVLPALAPSVLQGLRLATPLILIIVLLVEIVTRINGLGGQIQAAQEYYMSAAVYGLLVVTGLLVLAMNFIVGAVEGWLLRYRPR